MVNIPPQTVTNEVSIVIAVANKEETPSLVEPINCLDSAGLFKAMDVEISQFMKNKAFVVITYNCDEVSNDQCSLFDCVCDSHINFLPLFLVHLFCISVHHAIDFFFHALSGATFFFIELVLSCLSTL